MVRAWGEALQRPSAYKYRAFISYSHADTSWAKWLHRALEGFRIDKDLVGRETATGAIPKSLRPVFRDRDDFTAGHTLSEQTLAALDASHALIIICSPAAAKSAYVTEEIRLFKSRHPDRPVIPLIVDGKPGDAELECFPPALRFGLNDDGQVTDEPLEVLAADVREAGDGKHLALAKVVAGLLGVSSDDIYRRAERDRRRRQRSWIAGLSAVAIMLAGLAVWAEFNRREAEHNFGIAKQGAESLIFEIAQALRDQEGMRNETVRKILGTAEDAINKLVAKSPDNLELLHIQTAMLQEFALTYAAQGDTAKQQEAADSSFTVADRLVKADPGDPQWQSDLSISHERVGDVLLAQGKLADALKAYQDSLAIRKRIAEAHPGFGHWQHDLAVAYNRVGDVLGTQGDLPGALQAYREGLTVTERLVERDPDNGQWQSDVVVSYSKVGNVLVAQDKRAAALQAFRDGVAILKRQAEADPGDADRQRNLSVLYNKIGNVQTLEGDLPAALQTYRESLAIAERLAALDPDNADRQRDLAVSHSQVGDILGASGDLGGALQAYSDSLDIFERLAEANPGNSESVRDLSLAYTRAGDALKAGGDLDGALQAYNGSRALAKLLAEAAPGNTQWQRDLAMSYGKIGLVLVEQGEMAQALDEFREGRSIVAQLNEQSPENAQLANDVAVFDAEIAKLEQAQAAEPGAEPEQAEQ